MNKKRYVIAFLITIGFFIIGIFIGFQLSNTRISYLQESATQQRLDFDSLQVQYLYAGKLTEQGNCNAIEATLNTNILNLIKTQERLEQYEKESTTQLIAFRTLKREYTLAELRYWLLVRDTQDICHRDAITVVYFYTDDKNCPECRTEGFILTYLKKLFKDRLLVFSLDAELTEEPLVNLLIQSYNVTTYPSIIVNDELLEGFQNKDQVLQAVCGAFETTHGECPQTS